MLIVQACEFMFTGDGFYRHHEPSRFLARQPGVTVIDCHATHRSLWPLAGAADVLILPVLSGWEFFSMIERRRNDGKITVLETNDYFHEMQPWNPIAEYWLNPDVEHEHLEHIRLVDAVQTSTERLAEHWRPHAKHIAVFPNQLSSVPPLPAPPNRPLTIGWAGSQGHLADWYAITRYLQPWLDAHPEVNVAVMTHASAQPFLNLPSERYYFQQGGILDEYMEFLGRLDIGIAPLLPTEYNRCRSDVKYLEYAAKGVTGIYSNIGPYNSTVRHGENGYLYGSPEELLGVLDRLVADAGERQRVRQTAYDEVARSRRLEDHIHTRLEVYRSLLKSEPWSGELPAEVTAAAEIDGRYFRLISGDLEKGVLHIAQQPPSEQAAAQLQEVLTRYPYFVSCGRVLGRMLNDIGRPQQALNVGRHVLALSPGTAQTMSEIGRAYYLLGQLPTARQYLRDAVQMNPRHISSWSYLLRFVAKNFPNELAATISVMRAHLPNSYHLALLAVRLSPKKDALMNLSYILKEFSTKLSSRQRDAAAAEFTGAVETILGGQLEDPDCIRVIEQARAMFPVSAKLSTVYAKALRRQGRHEESLEALNHAHTLFQSARQFAKEYPQEDAGHYLWQIADSLVGKQ